MEDEIDLIINILKNEHNQTSSELNNKKLTINEDFNHKILKEMPNIANIKYNSRIEIDGGIIIKETIKCEEIKENDSRHANTWKKESKFLKNFYNNLSKIRYLNFRPYIDSMEKPPKQPKDLGYYFKAVINETKLINYTLEDNGFLESNSKDFTIYWSSSTIKQNIYLNLQSFQRVNHFPKSFEITRKDLLYKNLSKMNASFSNKGYYEFVPQSYILPSEYAFLEEAIEKDPSQIWIVKPVASSQGRGIFVTNRIQDIPSGINMIVSKYIWNPLLINGLKFDLRIYVLLMSILPLRIYIYEEGLARFATEKYFVGQPFQTSKYMHLTNYSVNKLSKNFVQNFDPLVDNIGNKWSLSALKKFFADNNLDWKPLGDKIEDIAIKTILSAETNIVNAYCMNIPWRNSCFELFGFDILIDSNFNPWLLEVNLSPSLGCDSPLDQKIKGELIAEIFDMARIVPIDLREKELEFYKNYHSDIDNIVLKDCSHIDIMKEFKITKEIKEMLWNTDEEFKRKRKFKRIFPNQYSLNYRKFFIVERPINCFLSLRCLEQSKNEGNRHELNKLKQINLINVKKK